MILEGKTSNNAIPVIAQNLAQTQQLISQRLGDFNSTVRGFRKTQASQERDTFTEFQRFRDNEFRDKREVSRQQEDRRDFLEDVGRDRRDFTFDTEKEIFDQRFQIADLSARIGSQQSRDNLSGVKEQRNLYESQVRSYQQSQEQAREARERNLKRQGNNEVRVANGFAPLPLFPVPEVGPAPQAPTSTFAPTPAQINIPAPSDFSGAGSNEFLESARRSSMPFQDRGLEGGTGSGLLPPIGPSINGSTGYQSPSYQSGPLPPVDGYQEAAPQQTSSASLGNSGVQDAPYQSGAHFGLAWEGRTDSNGNLPTFRAGELDGQSQEILGFGKGSSEYNAILRAKNEQGDDAALAVAQQFMERRAAPYTQGLEPQNADVVEGLVHHRGEKGVSEFLSFFGASNFQEVQQAAKSDPLFAERYKAARIQQEELNAERVYRTKKTDQSLAEFKRARQNKFGNGFDRRYNAEIRQFQSSPSGQGSFAPQPQQSFTAPVVAPETAQTNPVVQPPQQPATAPAPTQTVSTVIPAPQATPAQAAQVVAEVQQRTNPSVIVDEQAQTVTPAQPLQGDIIALEKELSEIQARNNQKKRDITNSTSKSLDRQLGTQIEQEEIRAAEIEAQIAEIKKAEVEAEKAKQSQKEKREFGRKILAAENAKRTALLNVDKTAVEKLIAQRAKFTEAALKDDSDDALEIFNVAEEALWETLPKTQGVAKGFRKEVERAEKQLKAMEDLNAKEGLVGLERVPKAKKKKYRSLEPRVERLKAGLARYEASLSQAESGPILQSPVTTPSAATTQAPAQKQFTEQEKTNFLDELDLGL